MGTFGGQGVEEWWDGRVFGDNGKDGELNVVMMEGGEEDPPVNIWWREWVMSFTQPDSLYNEIA